jgi:hypothetical protein
MCLRDIVLGSWIAGWTFFRAEPALAGDAALKLRAYFFTAALFEGIGAPAAKNGPRNYKQNRQRLHLLMIENECFNASGRNDEALKRKSSSRRAGTMRRFLPSTLQRSNNLP